MTHALVAGVGMIKFVKPGMQKPYRVMAAEAIQHALDDAGVTAAMLQQVYASYAYGDSTCGQHAFYDVSQTGVPVINVNNACASGSTALFLARQAVQSGAVDCALAFGFEEMQPGALGATWRDREHPVQRHASVLEDFNYEQAAGAIPYFSAAGEYYMDKYDAVPELFAKVAVKTRRHAVRNPYSLFSTPLTVEEVMASSPIYRRLTRFMACPPTCGAAAAIVVSKDFANRHGLSDSVEIIAQAMVSDTEKSWQDPINSVGAGMTRRAAEQVYAEAGLGPEAVQIIELHDCFTMNEVFTYEALGLCPEGGATAFVEAGDNTYGGKYVVNPSGGLMSKGHPIGATGLAQCFELVNQLRGTAAARQVENARLALQHNLGLSGAAVVTLYQSKAH